MWYVGSCEEHDVYHVFVVVLFIFSTSSLCLFVFICQCDVLGVAKNMMFTMCMMFLKEIKTFVKLCLINSWYNFNKSVKIWTKVGMK